jgi:hypothetical protein
LRRSLLRAPACCLNALECRAQHCIVDLTAADTHAFVVAQKVRRGIAADSITGVQQDCFEHRAARAFAVGAADGDDEMAGGQRKRLSDAQYALEPHSDCLRMQPLQITEPLVESLRFRVSGFEFQVELSKKIQIRSAGARVPVFDNEVPWKSEPGFNSKPETWNLELANRSSCRGQLEQ